MILDLTFDAVSSGAHISKAKHVVGIDSVAITIMGVLSEEERNVRGTLKCGGGARLREVINEVELQFTASGGSARPVVQTKT